jgi:hypothetical protein
MRSVLRFTTVTILATRRVLPASRLTAAARLLGEKGLFNVNDTRNGAAQRRSAQAPCDITIPYRNTLSR